MDGDGVIWDPTFEAEVNFSLIANCIFFEDPIILFDLTTAVNLDLPPRYDIPIHYPQF